MELDLNLLIFLASVMAVLLYLIRKTTSNISQKYLPPKAGGAWPIIGHLPLLGGSKLPHITLSELADKYGPIFTIKMGVHRALIVSDAEIAKECFTKNDIVFSNRPKSIALEHMTYHYAMFGFGPYGPYWRVLRKITTLELLSNHRLQRLRHVRESEVNTAIKAIHEQWAENNRVSVDMKKWFGDLTLNIALRTIVGKRWGESDDRCQRAMRSFFRLTGTVAVGDAIPWLRWFDLGGHEKDVKKTAKELDEIIEVWLDEHKRKTEGSEQDFMGVLVSILGGAEGLSSFDADTITKSTCLNLILGGADSTLVTLTWALALLLNNRAALKSVQQELDEQVGKERQVNESDTQNLVYLHAVMKETMRLHPPAPLLAPRESSDDCTVAGYHVPAGTRLFINASKLHRDPKVWSDPMEFRPERFLTTHKSVDVKGQSFELIPFGTGRRVCPGISFTLQVTLLALASLVQSFEITTLNDERIDMRESVGLSSLIASPIDVIVAPRLRLM